jgi:hypothetical protein
MDISKKKLINFKSWALDTFSQVTTTTKLKRSVWTKNGCILQYGTLPASCYCLYLLHRSVPKILLLSRRIPDFAVSHTASLITEISQHFGVT